MLVLKYRLLFCMIVAEVRNIFHQFNKEPLNVSRLCPPLFSFFAAICSYGSYLRQNRLLTSLCNFKYVIVPQYTLIGETSPNIAYLYI